MCPLDPHTHFHVGPQVGPCVSFKSPHPHSHAGPLVGPRPLSGHPYPQNELRLGGPIYIWEILKNAPFYATLFFGHRAHFVSIKSFHTH